MSPLRVILHLAIFSILIWVINASEDILEDNPGEGRSSKKKIKKAIKEAALLLDMVKNVGQLSVMVVAPFLLMKGVALSAFTALITFFWFAYELLQNKQPSKISVLIPSAPKRQEEKTTSSPTVAILPVVSSQDVHTYDYEDYNENVYHYKQHLGNKWHNLNRFNLHARR